MLIVLVSILSVLLVVTLLPMSFSQHYLIRSCDFVRLQVFYLALAGLLLGVYFALSGLSPLVVSSLIMATVILLIQGKWIYPYTWLAKKEVAQSPAGSGHSIRIMSANVLMSNTRYQDLIDLVHEHQPDLLITLESDTKWQQQLAAIEEDYPYKIFCPKDNRYGMHLYSKYKIKKQQVCELVENDIPSIHVLFETVEGLEVQGHFIHPAPPSPTEEDTSRPRDTELILLAKALKNNKRPTIVAGDLNDVAWSRSTRLFMEISDFLDPRKGRGFFNTFHAGYFFMRWPLDHLFHSHGFTVKRIKRLEKYGSDHFALLTELVHKPDNSNQQLDDDMDIQKAVNELQMENTSSREVPTFNDEVSKI
ncbi:MAG: endonuclease/exonuclease/phosphatase (EEP) superfamily protein YafD [Pseudoalteromonas rhizosphaerae]|jgi:endonuclease/exonuclease/phosphatase (EEP) superfamily protein YafD|uniref:Endonuclease/exonuclease/phosphatase family protein n=1 Tax=Pseudoalteromonas neustonica TaxID=1840331 RepID=A0ABY3F9U5_9GAMM|nr:MULTISPECIES: endonuclease/exonuclease/phosphatase family protein [Pseudoalteromonas]MBB1293129.1 endonuclease/exonuclease/phosphatase family protein [Pseudoalteromonas sp. SR41-4]MBB1310616.1 endonuclease/exonuclease/phosphatase family protein [Pseudoalteromonas sp. SR41-8]MBB1397087.1 endonuclease/exonuclease/phosphatase family protein [Pseudoalteromonas sp. SG44-8]MBB1408388.1 endonuclease/exonuclease/phosphatase family protein [Pseudoalteromonas sp. SG44-17]TVU80971.1 endonuclease/exonu